MSENDGESMPKALSVCKRWMLQDFTSNTSTLSALQLVQVSIVSFSVPKTSLLLYKATGWSTHVIQENITRSNVYGK